MQVIYTVVSAITVGPLAAMPEARGDSGGGPAILDALLFDSLRFVAYLAFVLPCLDVEPSEMPTLLAVFLGLRLLAEFLILEGEYNLASRTHGVLYS